MKIHAHMALPLLVEEMGPQYTDEDAKALRNLLVDKHYFKDTAHISREFMEFLKVQAVAIAQTTRGVSACSE